jgi:hypothetical protein
MTAILYREIVAQLVTRRVPEKFLRRVIDGNDAYRSLVLVSPWIDPMYDEPYRLEALVNKIRSRSIPTYVITREPEETWHREAVELLCKCATVEMNFNHLLHAKFYVCECVPHGFALLATSNLTTPGLLGYEVGLLVEGRGGGEPIVNKLRDLCLFTLRAFRETRRIKEIHRIGGSRL